jgi:glycosyltransferase involved in cell wall biosynthesis
MLKGLLQITDVLPTLRARIRADSSVSSESARQQALPRVLLLGTHVTPDIGSRSVGESLAERLRQRGFRLVLSSTRRSRASRAADMLFTAWNARHTYDVAQVDVYSGAAFRWAEWVTRLLRAIGKPVVLTLRGGNLPEFASKYPSRVARLLSSSAVVTAPSHYLAEAMLAVRSDVRVIPNALDLETYSYAEREHPQPNLIWLRTFHHTYDPVLAVQVLARVASYRDDARLTMIGPDKDGSLTAVRAEAERLRVLDRIRFTGGLAKSDVPRWLASGDIFLNTTTIDNAPVSVLEAMATGLLVVSTAVGGIPYLVEHENQAMLVPPRDAEKMAEAVKRLLTEPELAGRLSRNARATAERFGWDVVLPQWEALLLEVARRRAGGSA